MGRGRYGVVKEYDLILTPGKSRRVAMKQVKPGAAPNYFVAIGEELRILAHLETHPNIVELIGFFKGDLQQGEPIDLITC